MCNCIMQGSPGSASAKTQDRTTLDVLTHEDIKIRTAANAPAGDALLHGRVRRCRMCGAETENDRYCDACHAAGVELRTCTRCGQEFNLPCQGRSRASDDLCLPCLEDDARHEERAAEQARQCRIHRVRFVEDLPVSVLEEMQRGRC